MAVTDYLPFLEGVFGSGKPPRYMSKAGHPVHGILAEFETPAAVYHAAEKMRDAGFQKWDVHTPFPIHGMEEAMGVQRTKLPIAVAIIGLSGAGLGLLLQYGLSAEVYPLVVQGKPFGAWEPHVPITFEVGVLFGAFTAMMGMFMINGLPRFSHPLFNNERFLSSSDDRFFIVVEAQDERFDPETTRQMLHDIGASAVELVEDK